MTTINDSLTGSQDPASRPTARALLVHPTLIPHTARAFAMALGPGAGAGLASLSETMVDFQRRVAGECACACVRERGNPHGNDAGRHDMMATSWVPCTHHITCNNIVHHW